MNLVGLFEKELELKSIPTGSKELDEALHKGIRVGCITEIIGLSGVGKTRFCLQLLNNVATLNPKNESVYISTRPVNFLSEFPKLNILIRRCCNTAELLGAVYQLKNLVQNNKNIRLIVIDTYSTFLRQHEHMDRIRLDYEMLSLLQYVAMENSCAVVLVSQLTPDVSIDNSDSAIQLKPALGSTHQHFMNQQLLFTKTGKSDTVCVGSNKNLVKGPTILTMKIKDIGGKK